MHFTASEVVQAVRGDLVWDEPHPAAAATGPADVVTIDSASIDSRTVGPGQLFVPVVAERDGHDFIGNAAEAGASLYLTSAGVSEASIPAVTVVDTSAALMALGAAARDRMTGPVIGITGSVGKTSVKDLTAAACATSKHVHANPASFNNELGLPLTLVNAPDNVEVTVVEMGSRGQGHIQILCNCAKPTIGVVTRVAAVHTELFGSVEDVARAKGELIEMLPPSGHAILNADDPLVMAMAERSAAPVLTFGADRADVSTGAVQLDTTLRPRFKLSTPSGSVDLELSASGAHMALNAAAAMAAALAAGVGIEDAAAGLESARLSPMRMEVCTLASGATVINDAYNASPTSVSAALAALGEVGASRRVAVLGVMAELGAGEQMAHEQIADLAVAAGVEVIAVDAPWYGSNAVHVASPAEAAERLGPLGHDTAVLVKGSRVAALERLVDLLIAPTA